MYLIEILHQTTTNSQSLDSSNSCILSKFYIKPQHGSHQWFFRPSCILSKFYIKPQQRIRHKIGHSVVSYRNSTSNHNVSRSLQPLGQVVSYRNSTSNHNGSVDVLPGRPLYLIEILHQTTTSRKSTITFARLYLIEILHQTTTNSQSLDSSNSCILSKFYIKPQHGSHQWFFRPSCILSKFYIKPQQRIRHKIGHSVVSYRNSTSNHNVSRSLQPLGQVVSYRNSTSNHNGSVDVLPGRPLYLIEILHQTTTYIRCELILLSCILSKFYIKPQQRVRHKLGHSCCILSKFYIKPQLGVDRHLGAFVVSYRNSTSNHNSRTR